MSRQVVSAIKVLPPFEVVGVPKSIAVAVKLPSGEIMTVNVPISLFNSESEFLTAMQNDMEDIENSALMVKAHTLEVIQTSNIITTPEY